MHSPKLGATLLSNGTQFGVWSEHAAAIDLCLYAPDGATEIVRLPMERGQDNVFRVFAEGLGEGALYGFRASGSYAPDHGLWFDETKLLVDPYAKELDRPFVYSPRLSTFGDDTADIVPKARVVGQTLVSVEPPRFKPGGFVYEVAVKPFTILNEDVPAAQRGTVAALADPSVLAHLKRLGVDAVELMPITAWIDERHLPPLGLSNGWGYNPIAFMALDPRLCPGGLAELRETVAALHAEGIGVILDLVFNHSGESDRYGATLSMRGLDNLGYYRHLPEERGILVNDTGCGNTLALDHPITGGLVVDTLSHFVAEAAIDGFRFDLAPVLGREERGFNPNAALFQAIRSHSQLSDRVMIAEPWDIGPGGYQLGNFPEDYLEWNDRARDDMRRFWRGDGHMVGALATALAGSSPIFGRYGGKHTRSVNFLAAHDGFTLFDLVSHAHKHNEANGEENRDGHNENYGWNNGVEGLTDNAAINAARRRDVKALLATLFAARGTVMLTMGDEGGRSQQGNNNAYCQDNAITWLDWGAMDEELVLYARFLAGLRKRFDVFTRADFFTGMDEDICWLSPTGAPMTVSEWEAEEQGQLGMVVKTRDGLKAVTTRLAVLFNRGGGPVSFRLPGLLWRELEGGQSGATFTVPARSVLFAVEEPQ
jgi:glycogen operon protein